MKILGQGSPGTETCAGLGTWEGTTVSWKESWGTSGGDKTLGPAKHLVERLPPSIQRGTSAPGDPPTQHLTLPISHRAFLLQVPRCGVQAAPWRGSPLAQAT